MATGFTVTGSTLLLLLAAAIVVMVFMISKLKIHPFISLFAVALFMGLVSGLPLLQVTDTIAAGFGGTCGTIGVIILFGTIIGAVLEGSGGAITMADTVLRHVGEKRPALAMSIIGWIVSIPVFCDSGFVILSSLNRSMARRSGARMATMAIALSTGLYATHTLVPPTPGPIAAAGNLGADLGLVILWGIVVSIPAMLAGYLYAVTAGSRLEIEMPEGDDWNALLQRHLRLPSPGQAFAPLILPLLLIALSSAANYPVILSLIGKGSTLHTVITFTGTPMIALFIGLLLCAPLASFRGVNNDEDWSHWLRKGVRDGASIIMITAAGGSLGAIIAATKVGAYIGAQLARFDLGIFLPFIISAALKTAQGSSTVALITTSTITAPLLSSLGLGSPMGAVLATLSIGCGAMVVSHANDSYFWVVAQFSRMSVAQALRAQTAATAVQGIVAILFIWLLSLVML